MNGTSGVDFSRPFEAALVDLDGVVIDTSESIRRLWTGIAESNGVQLREVDFQRHVYGCSLEHTIDAVFGVLSTAVRIEIKQAVLTAEPHLEYEPVPEMLSYLKTLRREGVRTALVTGASLQRVCSLLGGSLTPLFTTLVTREDVTHGKPDPESYTVAAHRLGTSPDRCIVFEDAPSGVAAAVAAGANCIGIQDQDLVAHELLEAGAALVVKSIAAISPPLTFTLSQRAI